MDRTSHSGIFDFFGPDHDRFAFNGPVVRVTGGHAGESYLIKGSDRTAIIDCGNAYCAHKTIENIARELDGRSLDYIILTHSHYDHMGALSYIREAYPDAVTCGSEKCSQILSNPRAAEFIRKMGEDCRDLYEPGSEMEIRVDNISIDQVLKHGDIIELGDGRISCYETKGHTDCSMSFYLEPWSILFASESTGILEAIDYVHVPVLKDFRDSFKSLEICQGLNARYICNPHFGLLPEDFNDKYYELFRSEVDFKVSFVKEMMNQGLSFDDMFKKYCDKYWKPEKAAEQPYEAFAVNSGYVLKAVVRLIGGESDV